MIKQIGTRLWKFLSSFELTIVTLALLMALVFLCTLAQVQLGTLGAVNHYMRSWVVMWQPKESTLSLPVFPGGTLVGLVLVLNLIAATIKRLTFTWQKAGLWIVHTGLILLVAGEFATGAFQVDTNMAIEVGQTVNYVEAPRSMELAVIDTTDAAYDDVYSIPEATLAREGTVTIPGTPLAIRVRKFFRNANLSALGQGDAPSMATAGVGPGVKVVGQPAVTRDDEINHTTAFIEPIAGGHSFGTWLVSTDLGAPQGFTYEGRSYRLLVRPLRIYLPYAITLKKFSHDVYPGTDIPKNFSSLIHLSNANTGEERDVLIYMNQPMRYDGKAFYQASFGKGDTLSILQVVGNPGWLIPYISCVLVTIGLLMHFGITLRRSIKRRQTQKEG
ncbi:MAG TPA: cytochrome c biogenesis protein ResB [Holophagaceae bacterium]